MENEYFKPNPALKAATNVQDQVVGRQQAELDMAAMEAMKQTEELRMLDEFAAQQQAAGQQGLIAPVPVQKDPQGLGRI